MCYAIQLPVAGLQNITAGIDYSSGSCSSLVWVVYRDLP